MRALKYIGTVLEMVADKMHLSERNPVQVDVGSQQGQLRHWVRKTEGIGAKSTTCLVSITEFLIIFSTEILNMNKNRCGIIPKISSFTHVNEMCNFEDIVKSETFIIGQELGGIKYSFKIFIYLVCVQVFCLNVGMCTTFMLGAGRGQKRALDLLEMEL